ncbi:hypothetical protein PR048_009327 [Dryococelus australis]|uniref:Uncharacterized protein n=1 Tax=Dryococelus australis TaxID=614101 RepID=A0ABQ9I1F0_9NEOP|nr:hypothetical protein PR048_009327 [Dryococelus australis]
MPTVQGSGRKLANERSDETKIYGDSKYRCKYCELSLSCKIEITRTHLQKCSARNVKTTKEQKRDLNKPESMFYYAANVPFNVAKLDNFREMIQILRPGYKEPSAKGIGCELSDGVAQQIQLHMVEKVQNCSLTVTLTGWSNVNNDPIQTAMIYTGTESYLLKVYDAGSQKKMSVQYAVVIECQENSHSSIFAVFTDNENKMGKMWAILKENISSNQPWQFNTSF